MARTLASVWSNCCNWLAGTRNTATPTTAPVLLRTGAAKKSEYCELSVDTVGDWIESWPLIASWK